MQVCLRLLRSRVPGLFGVKGRGRGCSLILLVLGCLSGWIVMLRRRRGVLCRFGFLSSW